MGCCTPRLSCDWLVLGPWGAQGPVGTECNLDGKGGQDPTDGLGQFTDVGESHRSTGHLVTWSPLIRLWAGVLVYETLGALRLRLSSCIVRKACTSYTSLHNTY